MPPRIPTPALRLTSTLRRFLSSEAAGGVILMGAAALALIVANSPLSAAYHDLLHAYLGPLSVQHWINDLLMAVFFLLVGLEIKREVLLGELSTWPRRVLPGIAALGGVVVPALIFVAINAGSPDTLRGWAVPMATDIAFALGVLALLGDRVPVSLKIFLTALAIIDDLVAVVIIGLFYSEGLSPTWLGAALAILVALWAMNRARVLSLWPYLLLGAGLWGAVLMSGIHATLAGVLLAFAIPLRVADTGQGEGHPDSPLHDLEHAIQPWVAFLIVPVFGFANAGVDLRGLGLGALLAPLPLGIALGLLVGKQVGVLLPVWIATRLGWAPRPEGASALQVYGVALLCGIGFTMSLFIGLLAFPGDAALQDAVRLGVLAGSLASGLLGAGVLVLAGRPGRAVSPA